MYPTKKGGNDKSINGEDVIPSGTLNFIPLLILCLFVFFVFSLTDLSIECDFASISASLPGLCIFLAYLNFNLKMGSIHTPCSEKYLPFEKRKKNKSLCLKKCLEEWQKHRTFQRDSSF